MADTHLNLIFLTYLGHGNVRFRRFQIQFRELDYVQNGGHRRCRCSRSTETHGAIFH